MHNRSPKTNQPVLATDLDGTLIPLENHANNTEDLRILSQRLQEQNVMVCFATGRDVDRIRHAIDVFQLPEPDWIVADVGSAIYSRNSNSYALNEGYRDHLQSLLEGHELISFHDRLRDLGSLRFQEEAKQSEFKVSYYVEGEILSQTSSEIRQRLADCPVAVIDSLDPYSGEGLIDLLPAGVSKAYALNWWAGSIDIPHSDIVFAGDSGNDLAAFRAGFRSIIVGNAPAWLSADVLRHHAEQNWDGRCYVAAQSATSGVLEGCQHYQLI